MKPRRVGCCAPCARYEILEGVGLGFGRYVHVEFGKMGGDVGKESGEGMLKRREDKGLGGNAADGEGSGIWDARNFTQRCFGTCLPEARISLALLYLSQATLAVLNVLSIRVKRVPSFFKKRYLGRKQASIIL